MSGLLEFIQTHEEAFHFASQRSTNPDGYNANSNAWLRALASAANAGVIPSQTGDRYVLHAGEHLASSLNTQEHGRPLALGAVIEDAIRKKEFIPLGAFLDAKGSVHSSSWIPTPWQAMQWGLRQLGVVGGPHNNARLAEEKLVILANVEAASKSILNAAATISTSNSSRVFSRDLFTQTFSPILGVDTLTPTDLTTLLTHLSRERGAISYSRSSGVIKFPSPSDPSPPAISQEDVSIASLRTLISSLESQVSGLTARIASLDASARGAVADRRPAAAKTCLRQKRQAEATLARRAAGLAQLEAVYAGIEQAADQVEILGVLRDAGRTLKSLNARTGGVEAVQDVVEGLREEMATAEEIGHAMNEVSAGEVDEGEVEEELERLEEREREREREKEGEKVDEGEKGKETGTVEAEVEVEETRKKLAELDVLETPRGEIKGDEKEREAERDAA